MRYPYRLTTKAAFKNWNLDCHPSCGSVEAQFWKSATASAQLVVFCTFGVLRMSVKTTGCRLSSCDLLTLFHELAYLTVSVFSYLEYSVLIYGNVMSVVGHAEMSWFTGLWHVPPDLSQFHLSVTLQDRFATVKHMYSRQLFPYFGQ